MRMQVQSLALLSGSGIQRCRELWQVTELADDQKIAEVRFKHGWVQILLLSLLVS